MLTVAGYVLDDHGDCRSDNWQVLPMTNECARSKRADHMVTRSRGNVSVAESSEMYSTD